MGRESGRLIGAQASTDLDLHVVIGLPSMLSASAFVSTTAESLEFQGAMNIAQCRAVDKNDRISVDED